MLRISKHTTLEYHEAKTTNPSQGAVCLVGLQQCCAWFLCPFSVLANVEGVSCLGAVTCGQLSSVMIIAIPRGLQDKPCSKPLLHHCWETRERRSMACHSFFGVERKMRKEAESDLGRLGDPRCLHTKMTYHHKQHSQDVPSIVGERHRAIQHLSLYTYSSLWLW